MLVTVTNASTGKVYLSAIRKTLAVSEAVTFTRTQAQLDAEVALKALVAAGTVTMSIAAQTTDTVDTGETIAAPGPTTLGISETMTIRKAFTAGVTGAADDVTLMAAAPFGFRIVDAVLYVATASAGATVTLRTATGGAGSALSQALSVNATGVVRPTTSTATTTVAAAGGVYLRRSDRACAGEIVVTVVKT